MTNWFRLIPRCPLRGQALYTKNHLFENTIHSDLEVGIFICHSLLIYSGEVEFDSWRSTISLLADFVSRIGLYGFFHLWEAVNMYNSICFIFLLIPFKSVF